MAYRPVDMVGVQPITDVSTTQLHPYGTRIKCIDTAGTYPPAEFVYVKGVTGGAVGLACTYIPSTGVTALTGARSKGLVGIMVSILDATTDFGWIQVSGAAQVLTPADVGAGATVYTTATAGKLDDAVTAGDIVYGANFEAARTGAGAVSVAINNPYVGDTDNS